jgi:rhamnopyranosyl-N-acetylglucosaminyl-diphospho-decaprenol beta-1,3/1,4-galactofuranosyltransferase
MGKSSTTSSELSVSTTATEITDIFVGIVTLNRLDKLVHTLSECRTKGFRHFVVIDNGSTDGTREFLAQQQDITCVFTDRNEGGSGGFHRIKRHFYEKTSFEFLLLMDDDAYPGFTRDHLIEFLAQRRSANHMAFACRVVYPDGTLCAMNRPGKNVLAHHPFKHFNKDFHIDDSSQETDVDFAGFVGLVLTRQAIRIVGVVSTEFFIYSDDTYYTLAISQTGGKILYCPQLTFVHDCKRSSRNLIHHDAMRLERDVVNKIVMIREYSRFGSLYVLLYLLRLLWKNPSMSGGILRAASKGVRADLALYRNQPV